MKYKQSGIGLIELLVALVISSLVLLAVVQLFIQTKISYVSNESLTRLQENGRFAIQMIARDIRSADYWGCLPQVTGNAALNVSPLVANLVDSGGNPVTAYNSGINPGVANGGESGTGTGPAGATQLPDTITLVSAQTANNYPVAATAQGTDAVSFTVTGDSGIDAGDLVMIGECTHAQIIQVTNEPDPSTIPSGERVAMLQHSTTDPVGNPNPNNASASLQYTFTENAIVYPRVRNITYSIDDGSGTVSGLPGLMRNGAEVASGIENMQIQYGLDTDSDGVVNQYVSGNSVGDFEQVISIRIALVVRSPDARNGNAASYKLMGEGSTGTVNAASITPDANGLYPDRRVYTQTIALRNRFTAT